MVDILSNGNIFLLYVLFSFISLSADYAIPPVREINGLLCDILARKSAMTDYMGIERYDGPNSVYLCSSVSSQNSQGGMITAV